MEDIGRLAQFSRPGLYKHFENKSAIFLALARAFLVSCLQEAEVELQRSSPVWKRITAAFDGWSVKLLEMIVVAPHADEVVQAGSGLAANVYREETERFARILAGVLRDAARKGELNLKRAGLIASSAADLLVATVRGAKEDGKDPGLYWKRLVRLIRVFDCATSSSK